jgi:hypothetical protein
MRAATVAPVRETVNGCRLFLGWNDSDRPSDWKKGGLRLKLTRRFTLLLLSYFG